MQENNNNIILLEFNDLELYKKHYICLYSFSNDSGYDDFTKQLLHVNSEIASSIKENNGYNFKDINEIQNSKCFIPWTTPWIEFIDEEFISTIWPITTKNENQEVKYLFTKSFYLFIDDEWVKNKFFDFLKKKLPYNSEVYANVMETYYFYEIEKFERPISFCVMIDLKNNLIFKMEVHHFEAVYGNNSEESLIKQKNFYYFYRTLYGIKEDIISSTDRIDDKSFIRRTVIDNLKKHAGFCI